jgi:dTDP-4-amino-4,6-dideoxygalactose transaminase
MNVDQVPDDRLRFQRPWLPEADSIERYLALSRRARWFSNGGPCWHLLRERLADRCGAHCIPVASGTAGLLAAVAALTGSRSGEAVLPSFTFPATAQAALWNGLTPRLVDVDPDHWHLDPRALERILADRGRKIAVVIAVSSFGTPPPAAVRRRWEHACASAGVPLIVDSAAAFGAVGEDGVSIGGQGDVEVVSFHATKPFAVGEGGAVFTRDDAIRDRVEKTINFGFDRDHAIEVPIGLNGKMSELHAAVGLAVLDEFDAILSARRQVAGAIRDAARPGVAWQWGCERSTWQFVPARFENGVTRDRTARRAASTLETRVYYEPLHLMDRLAARCVCDGTLPVTETLAREILALPMANDLMAGEVQRLVDAVGEPRPVPAVLSH